MCLSCSSSQETWGCETLSWERIRLTSFPSFHMISFSIQANNYSSACLLTWNLCGIISFSHIFVRLYFNLFRHGWLLTDFHLCSDELMIFRSQRRGSFYLLSGKCSPLFRQGSGGIFKYCQNDLRGLKISSSWLFQNCWKMSSSHCSFEN